MTCPDKHSSTASPEPETVYAKENEAAKYSTTVTVSTAKGVVTTEYVDGVSVSSDDIKERTSIRVFINPVKVRKQKRMAAINRRLRGSK